MEYKDIEIGDIATVERDFDMEDLLEFSRLSLDENPIHLDVDYGKNSMFKDNIVQGMLVASLISGVLSERIPGHGTIYMGQDLRFVRPVFPGDRCIATVEVLEKRDEKNIIILGTRVCVEDEDNVVIEGKAIVKKP